MDSPLIHGKIIKTPLDNITKNLWFIFPLNQKQINFLNTVIYKNRYIWINYWSLTHIIPAIVFGLIFNKAGNNKINKKNLIIYLILHSLFEIWELYAGGYLSGKFKIDIMEINDIIFDTLFAILGFYISIYLL